MMTECSPAGTAGVPCSLPGRRRAWDKRGTQPKPPSNGTQPAVEIKDAVIRIGVLSEKQSRMSHLGGRPEALERDLLDEFVFLREAFFASVRAMTRVKLAFGERTCDARGTFTTIWERNLGGRRELG
jgi:hypothetical protein